MEIRIINRNREIVNISNMAVITAMSRWIVGINDRGETTKIEKYGDEVEAKRALKEIGKIIVARNEFNVESVIIKTYKEEEEEEDEDS